MTTNQKERIYPALKDYIEGLLAEIDLISEARKELLVKLAKYILRKRTKDQEVFLNFICTHNSRRSQISQIWAATAAAYFGLDGISTYSGGTEATAFNPRAVAAINCHIPTAEAQLLAVGLSPLSINAK